MPAMYATDRPAAGLDARPAPTPTEDPPEPTPADVDALIHRFTPLVRLLARKLCAANPAADPDELYSAGLVALWRHAASITAAGCASGFVATVARRAMIDVGRTERRRRERAARRVSYRDAESMTLQRLASRPFDDGLGFDELVSFAPDRHRALLRAYYRDGELLTEIADRIGVCPQTVRSRINDAVGDLRGALS